MNQSAPPMLLDFSTYITERTRDFTGREWLFATIDRWLAKPDASQFFLLTGEPGIGKTAIAARLTQFSQGASPLPDDLPRLVPGFLSAVHFCSARDRRWINPHVFAQSLALQLARRYPLYAQALAEGVSDQQVLIQVKQQVQEVKGGQVAAVIIGDLHVSGTSPEDAFSRIVREPLEALVRANPATQIVIQVDALDEALLYTGEINIVSLVAEAERLPPGVRFIILSRRDERVENEFWDIDGIYLSAAEFEPRNQVDLRRYAGTRLSQDEKLAPKAAALEPAQVRELVAEITDQAAGNFQYASFLLDTMASGQRPLTELEGLPEGLDGLYYDSLERVVKLENKDWAKDYSPLMGVLSVAQASLTCAQLKAFTGQSAIWEHLGNLQQFIKKIEPGENQEDEECGYQLYHQSLVDFLRQRFLRTKRKRLRNRYYLPAATWHRQITDYYWGTCSACWLGCDRYGIHHLPAHLLAAGQVENLRELLLDFDWLQAKLDATDTAALIADYELLLGDAELRLVQGALRLSAHVLAQDKTHLAGQLLGRLLSQEAPGIQVLLNRAQGYSAAPWLRPLAPSLALPGGPLLRTMTGHTGGLNAVAVTLDRRVISAADDHTLKVWDLESGAELVTLTGHIDEVTAVAVIPDGQYAVSASKDKTLKLWDLENGELRLSLQGHAGPVNAVAVTSDGRAISASADRSLKVWDLESGVELSTLIGHTEAVTAVTVTPDNQRAISASVDETLILWNLESGAPRFTFRGHAGPVNAVALTPDGQRVISASNDFSVKIWDLESRRELHTLLGHADRVAAVTVTPDGNQIISASHDKVLKVWDLDGAELLTLAGHTNRVMAVAVAPDGRRVVSASDDTTLRVWDLRAGTASHTRRGHTAEVNAVAVTPDGRYALSASEDHTLRMWSLKDGAELCILHGHTEGVTAVAITPDSQRAVSAAGSPYSLSGSTLMVWDLEHREKVRGLEGHDEVVRAMTVMPDGRHSLFASRDCTIKLWDLESGEKLHDVCRDTLGVTAVAVLPSCRRVISACWNTLKIWNLETGDELLTLRGHTDYVNAVVVTPDGRHAVSASHDTTLKVWDLESGAELSTLRGHTRRVNALAITQDGRYLLSASHDLFLKVWDLGSGQVVASFIGESSLLACAVAPDGRTVVAGEQSGQVHILRLEGV